MHKTKKPDSQQEAKQKIIKFCTYQERTENQVLEKLNSMDLSKKEIDKIFSFLRDENFLNENRFVNGFVYGKFSIKKWGKIKIKYHLMNLGIPETRIIKGLNNIDPDEYQTTLSRLINSKMNTLKEANDLNIYSLRHKVSQYVIQKGYEPDLVWEILKSKV